MEKEIKIIRIGTRGSPLALAQVELVCQALKAAKDVLPFAVEPEVVVIKTSGDWVPAHGERALSAADGGKGQFAKEIEAALLAGEIDVAVHSMKDMDSHSPEGLVIDCMLPREDVRDAILLSDRSILADNSQLKNDPFSALPKGCVAGMASVRRAAILKSYRPDIEITPLRGNVQTRIDKLRGKNPDVPRQNVGCTFLAMAGLNRLGLSDEADIILEPEAMLPAAGQGAVGIQMRSNDRDILAIFSYINDEKTELCVKAEREVLRVLDGSCHTPIGAYAIFEGSEMWLRVCVLSVDGTQKFESDERRKIQNVDEAVAFGHEVGQAMKARIPADILS